MKSGKYSETSHVRTVLAAVRLPRDKFADHSFCIGAATTGAMAGIEDSKIYPQEFCSSRGVGTKLEVVRLNFMVGSWHVLQTELRFLQLSSVCYQLIGQKSNLIFSPVKISSRITSSLNTTSR